MEIRQEPAEAQTEYAYETPVLLDAADLAGAAMLACGVCITGGGAAHMS